MENEKMMSASEMSATYGGTLFYQRLCGDGETISECTSPAGDPEKRKALESDGWFLKRIPVPVAPVDGNRFEKNSILKMKANLPIPISIFTSRNNNFSSVFMAGMIEELRSLQIKEVDQCISSWVCPG